MDSTCQGPGCQNPLIQPRTGRRRRFCSPACRKAASRARASSWTSLREYKPQLAEWPGEDVRSMDEYKLQLAEWRGEDVRSMDEYKLQLAEWRGEDAPSMDDIYLAEHGRQPTAMPAPE
jgi:hypothetical protein